MNVSLADLQPEVALPLPWRRWPQGSDTRTSDDSRNPTALCFGEYRIPSDIDLVYRGRDVVPLEPLAVRVLRYLAQREGRVVPKNELLETLWPDVFTTEAVLKRAVSQARRALGDDPDAPRFIETHHRRGYRFVAAVSRDEAGPRATPGRVTRPSHAASDPDYSQLVGRGIELEALEAEYRRTVAKVGRPVLVTGDAGIGKTQLARRFERWCTQQGALCLYARFFDDAGAPAPDETFADLLRLALEHETPEVRATILDSRGAACIGTGFVRLSRRRPVVLILDDLQWAGASARDLTAYLMRAALDTRLLIVGLCRAAELESPDHDFGVWVRRQAGYRSFSTLSLRPLTEADCCAGMEAVFGGSRTDLGVPASDLRRLYEISGGRPFVIMETLRLLVAEGAISRASGAWRWRGLERLRVPDSVVMAARGTLEQLPGDVRALVAAAASIGDAFAVKTLAALVNEDAELVEERLRRALSAGVLTRRDVAPGQDYRFTDTSARRLLCESPEPAERRRRSAALGLSKRPSILLPRGGSRRSLSRRG